MVRSVPYEIVRHMGEAELRRYDDLVLATVYDLEEDESFELLFRYISGSNESGAKLPMITPVVTRTANPAGSRPEGQMSFVLPVGVELGKAPKPNDPRVVLERKEGGFFAVMRFRGRAEEDDVGRMIEELLGELKEADFITDGRPFVMRYNSPFMPSFMRRNEVAVRATPGPERSHP